MIIIDTKLCNFELHVTSKHLNYGTIFDYDYRMIASINQSIDDSLWL